MNQKRKDVQDFILKYIRMLDQTEYNPDVYEKFFTSMDDAAFDKWMHTLRSDKNAKLTFLVPPLKVVINLERAFKVAKELGVKIFERIRLWDPVGKRYCLTSQEYMVLRLPVRRLRQYLMDGLSVPDSDKRLNPLTDQVVGPSKGSAISYPQAQMIAEKGLVLTLQELMTIRGGNLAAYSKMVSEIVETGESDTRVSSEGTGEARAVTTLRSYMNGMHLEINL